MTVIEKLLADPWKHAVEAGREVPEAIVEDGCIVSSISPFTPDHP